MTSTIIPGNNSGNSTTPEPHANGTTSPTPRSTTGTHALSEAGARILSDRYTAEVGHVHLTGIQALVRMIRDRALADRARGLNTASYISGYEGSPLGGYDLELAKRRSLLAPLEIVHEPGVNEELGATAVQGSQLAADYATLRDGVDGVVGYWYGKAPGVDRSADAFRHANLAGTSTTGGAVAIVGDDPESKSSTVPSNSSGILADLGMPTLVPTDSSDVLFLGNHAAWMSRYCNLWVALRVSTPVADGSSTVTLDGPVMAPETPTHTYLPRTNQLGAPLLQAEASMRGERLDRAKEYAKAHSLNRLVRASSEDKIGIIAAGVPWLQAEEALRDLGSPRGVRVARLGMTYPLLEEEVTSFAQGLAEIIVVEDIGDHLTHSVREVLYESEHRPRVTLVRKISRDLPGILQRNGVEFTAPQRPSAPPRQIGLQLAVAPRVPHFCSGCPHNMSTRTSPDTLVGAGIGCHAMVMLMDKERVGNVIGTAQMGGEGAHWIGISPFTQEKHLVQNMGDGTFMHSGTLALRALVAAKRNVTMKILHNGTVAMTGGQDAVGSRGLSGLVEVVRAEAPAKIVVTTDDVRRTRRLLPREVDVRPREELAEVQQELAAVPGVTVLIHDQHCAAEKRRARSRGKLEQPVKKVVINERICEGCGDCGEKSGCLSVRPVDTEFGRKTQIDQTSCNADYTCLQGDCPAFMTVTASTVRGKEASSRSVAALLPPLDATALPPVALHESAAARGFAHDPVPGQKPAAHGSWNVRITGVGGTGVLTLSAVIATAGQLDGFFVRGQDQTGLAQKGGSVISDVRLSVLEVDEPGSVPEAAADLLIGVDGLTTAEQRTLNVIDPARTVAVLSTTDTPTGVMCTDVKAQRTDGVALAGALGKSVARSIALDAAELAEQAFGATTYQTMLMLGAAVQSGSLPLRAETVELALAANGREVEQNIQAFRRGRQLVADPEGFAADLARIQPAAPQVPTVPGVQIPAAVRERVRRALTDYVRAEVLENAFSTRDGALSVLDAVALRVAEMQRWGGEGDATRLLQDLVTVCQAEQRVLPGSTQLLDAAAFGLHKLGAYKDEYEVARLAVEPALRQQLRENYGEDSEVKIQLHPPMLRYLGMKQKIALGRGALPLLQVLARMKKLRGTPLDVFGMTKMRALEREIAETYRRAVLAQSATLRTVDDLATAVDVALLADEVRGYEQRKEETGRKVLEQLRQLVN